ncbi:EAL domain-containing protein [Paenibacillus sp. HB172176]|uniref:EAL domain-containing protein n=1 Tax=Paenibacillus sp. HB172176 TaxID=2493690 RepID=UPI001439EB38|nr:EAL domain-containing protein [Paenibacillus sp. HB172176]
MTVFQSRQGLPKALGLQKEEALTAYYQPIIALDSRRISGYEVLGRATRGDAARSLGPFFGDPGVAMADHIQVDRILREQAIARMAQEADPPLLFLNLKPGWIYQYGQSGEMHTLDLIDRYGLDPGRVVIEITEESFNGSVDILIAAVERYRARGCRIAIDDVGSGFSNWDRIAQLQPNLLKIDMDMVKKSATHNGYYGVLRSFSELAEQIGASLLFEGVETRDDLERAIQAGARYVQGFLFAQAEPSFREPDCFADVVEEELERHVGSHALTEGTWKRRAERLAEQLSLQLPQDEEETGGELLTDACLKRLIPELEPSCIRIYICNRRGIQLSANFRRDGEAGWQREEQYRHANWSWRPYFVPNLVQLSEQRRSIVSRSYTDLESRAWIRTISVMVRPDWILFADVLDGGSRIDRS